MTPLWLTVLLSVVGYGGGYASALAVRRGTQVDRETARRAETRERVFEALKLLTTGGVSGQRSGLAILQATYDSDKLDPDDLTFVQSQLHLFAADDVAEPVDNPVDETDTGTPVDLPEDPS